MWTVWSASIVVVDLKLIQVLCFFISPAIQADWSGISSHNQWKCHTFSSKLNCVGSNNNFRIVWEKNTCKYFWNDFGNVIHGLWNSCSCCQHPMKMCSRQDTKTLWQSFETYVSSRFSTTIKYIIYYERLFFNCRCWSMQSLAAFLLLRWSYESSIYSIHV